MSPRIDCKSACVLQIVLALSNKKQLVQCSTVRPTRLSITFAIIHTPQLRLLFFLHPRFHRARVLVALLPPRAHCSRVLKAVLLYCTSREVCFLQSVRSPCCSWDSSLRPHRLSLTPLFLSNFDLVGANAERTLCKSSFVHHSLRQESDDQLNALCFYALSCTLTLLTTPALLLPGGLPPQWRS